MKIFKKTIIVLLLSMMMIGVATTSVFAWSINDSESNWTCTTVNDAISYYETQLSKAGSFSEEERWENLITKATKYKNSNCSCVNNGISYKTTSYTGPNGWTLVRFSGDVFCIEATKLFKDCTKQPYTTSTGDYNEDVAMAIAAFNKTGKSDEDYAAAQYLVWIALGQASSVPGSLQSAANHLKDIMNDGVEIHKSMNVSPESSNMVLGESKQIAIGNYGSYGKSVDGSNAPGLGLNGVSSDKLTATLNSIYPINKKVTINGKDRIVEGGTLSGTMSIKHADDSQDFAMFDGKFASLKITVFDPAEFTVKTNTGDLKLYKFDEWGDNAGPNIKFQIWYAKEDPNGLAIDDDGKTYSKYLPYVVDTNPTADMTPTTFTTNDDGFFQVIGNLTSVGGEFADGTKTGYYIIEETEITQSFVENTTEYNGKETVSYAFHINTNQTTTINVENDRRTVKETIVKRDAEEAGEMENETLYLNNAEFTVYDMSVEKDLSIDTVNGTYSTKDVPILRVGKSVNLNTLLGGLDVSYRIKNAHCNTASLEGSTLTANEPDIVEIEVLDGDTVVRTEKIYQIAANDNSIISSLDSDKLTGLPVFKGLTGHSYIQLVDHDIHNLPLRNAALKIYEDGGLTTEIAELTSDDFGMIDLKDIAENYDTVYYKDPVNNAVKEKVTKVDKGTLDVEYLRHSRYYLVAESKTPEDYDIERDTKYNSPNGIVTSDKSPVYILHTNFAQGVSDHTTELTNMKVRGDLKMTKLDEYERLAEPGTKFKIYHAALIDNSLSYEMTYKNLKFEEDGVTPIKDEVRGSIKNPKSGDDIFTVGEDSAFEIMDYLYYGYYVLEEVEASNAYDLSNALMLFDIRHSELSDIAYTNTNRTVSFKIYKNDVEEEYRYLDGAEFTVFDITSPISGSWKKGDLDNNLLDFELLYTIKAGKSVNLRDLYLEYHPEVAEEVGNLPLKVQLSHIEMGTVDVNNIFTSNGEAGKTTIKFIGGNYDDIYAKFIGDDLDEKGNAYLNSTFNANEIDFFYDSDADKELEPLTYEVLDNTVDTTTLGTYSVIYKVIDKKGVEYIMEREVKVIEDHRPIFDVDANEYRDPITNKVVPEPKVKEPEVVKLFDTKQATLPEGYEGKDFGSFDLYTLEANGLTYTNVKGNPVNLTESDVTIFEGVRVFRGTTGKKEIQIVDFKHHNLPLEQEVTLYLDEDAMVELGKYKSDVDGMIDLTDAELTPKLIDFIVDEETGDKVSKVLATEIEFKDTPYDDLDSYIGKYLAEPTKYEVGILTANIKDNIGKLVDINSEDAIKTLVSEKEIVADEDLGTKEKIEVLNGKISVLKTYDETEFDENVVYYIDKYDELRKIEIDYDEVYKNTTANYLKHSRIYLAVETKLSIGYDYVEDRNPMFVIDTYQYDVGVDGKDTTIGNKLRRIDMVLYKINASKSVKLNGAVFDIWDLFEEGKDLNVIKHIKNADITKQGTEYDLDVGKIFTITETSLEEDYKDYLEDSKYVIVDSDGNEYGSKEYKEAHTVKEEILDPDRDLVTEPDKKIEVDVLKIVGDVYEVYVPDTIERTYLGRYVSGGIYVQEKDALENAIVRIATDSSMNNVVKSVNLNKDGDAKVLGLADGLYYYQLQRPLKDDFEQFIYVAPEGYTKDEDPASPTYGKAINDLDPTDIVDCIKEVNIPTDADRVPLSELPECYSTVHTYYVAKGMIMLPQIKYAHTIQYKEIEAPAGYYFDNALTTVDTVADYGINRVENFRINNAIIINNGVRFD